VSEALAAAKASLRRRMLQQRDAVTEPARARAALAVRDRLLSAPWVSRGRAEVRTAMVFWSFGSELPTGPIIRALAEAGWGLALPVVEAGVLSPVAYDLDEPVAPTGYGPSQPVDLRALDPGDISLVVVPGLAFDAAGHRVGYGAGYYDRFLPSVPGHVLRVAVGFDLQIVDEGVPHGAGDQPVDAVVTEARTLVTGAGTGRMDPGGAI
jgi:5-formyltetrahydrofolate cyclo-ligase